MEPIIAIQQLNKRYATGTNALQDISLEIRRGEIFALLGPNGAGKTTLINIICGLVTPSGGRATVGGFDIIDDFRKSRALIGLVPQELQTDMFEKVIDTVNLSRGLFGLPANAGHIEKLLKDLALWDKRSEKIMTLSGGMKRRVLIAKALAHEPRVLFLDEPTAGVDVELRRDMWSQVRRLRDDGVTIILTTHYIEEAEEMADRIGVIHQGRLIVVEDKQLLMKKLGTKQLVLSLLKPLTAIPESLRRWTLALRRNGEELEVSFNTSEENPDIDDLLKRLGDLGIGFKDLQTRQSSLEEIFVGLVHRPATSP